MSSCSRCLKYQRCYHTKHNGKHIVTFFGLNATEPFAHFESGPSFFGKEGSTQWLLLGKAVSPPCITSACSSTIACLKRHVTLLNGNSGSSHHCGLSGMSGTETHCSPQKHARKRRASNKRQHDVQSCSPLPAGAVPVVAASRCTQTLSGGQVTLQTRVCPLRHKGQQAYSFQLHQALNKMWELITQMVANKFDCTNTHPPLRYSSTVHTRGPASSSRRESMCGLYCCP